MGALSQRITSLTDKRRRKGGRRGRLRVEKLV
jgi:hypothetical protein